MADVGNEAGNHATKFLNGEYIYLSYIYIWVWDFKNISIVCTSLSASLVSLHVPGQYLRPWSIFASLVSF